jgi:hypothetical protein
MAFLFGTSYQDTEITEKTKYWVDLWDEIIDDFSTKSYDKDLINPHLLLINIVDEIKFNNLKNSRINSYFIEKLNYFLKEDAVVEKSFNTDFTLIRNELVGGSKRFGYFIILCEQTIKSFKNGSYYEDSCNRLKELILDSQWKDKDEDDIYLLSLNLIVELILAGYTIDEIKTIPSEIFSKYSVIEKGENIEIIRTKYPTSVNAKNYYDDGVLNKKTYYEAIKVEIDSLSISDRLDKLKSYFSKEYSEGYGIFHIEGLKGNIDINLGDVNFYSPKSEGCAQIGTIYKTKYDNFNELKLEFNDDKDPSFVNAAAKIKHRGFDSAQTQALEVIEKALDIIRVYAHSETPLRIKLNHFYLVDCEDLLISSHFSSDGKRHIKDYYSFDVSKSFFCTADKDEYLNNLNNIFLNNEITKSPLSAKLTYSLHWYRKAFETNNREDKLLNYWIVIENLITFDSKNENIVLKDKEERDKFTLIEEIVPFIELSFVLKNVASDAYDYFDCLTFNWDGNSDTRNGNDLEITPECLNKCQLGSQMVGKEINLVDFVQNINLLKPCFKRKLIENKIVFVDRFYNDTKFTKSEVERSLKQTKQDLLLIYRYRNLIVHNAHFDNNILPYYVMKAENIAGNLLRELLYQHIQDNTKSQQDILIQIRVKMERMIKRLDSNIPVDLWKF